MAKAKEVLRFIEREMREFNEAIASTHDRVIDLLRFHLLAENTLERIILAKLPLGHRLIEDAGLSFSQKLTLVEALAALENPYVQALRHLNSVRNKCVHQRGRTLTSADIELFGRPFGKLFRSETNTMMN